MQSSYPANPFHHAINQTINRASALFSSNRFPMTRPPVRPESKAVNPVARVSPSIAIEDWDVMFTAVIARLTLVAQSHNPSEPQPTSADPAQVERVCGTVAECVAALNQLQRTARDELMVRDRLRG